MRFWTFLVVLVYVRASDAARTVTNEDIRDAILSVVNMIRSTEDKLERHEFRERTLGDQIKKALSTIDKRQRLLDPVKGTIGRLDERLASVETILLQKDERERIQMQKVFDMVEQIHNSLPQLFETLKNDITSSLPKESEEPSPSKVDLERLQKEIEHKIDNTSSNVKNLEGQLSKIREENKNNFSSNQKFLEKYQNKLTEYNKQIDVLPAKCKEVNDVQTDVILKALETQSNNIKKLQKDTDASNALVKSFEKKLSELQGDAKNNQRLNDSTSQNLENVKKHINNSQEVLKKYEAKLNEYNKNIDVLPATYKNENEAQTKSILKAFETQNDSVKKIILNAKSDVLKNCEIADKYLKEAFPHQNKALANIDAALKSDKENLDKRLSLVHKILNETQEFVVNKIEACGGRAEIQQNELEESINNSIKTLHENLTRAFDNNSVTTMDNVDKALGYQKTKILDSIGALEKHFNTKTDDIKQEIKSKNANITDDFKQLQNNIKSSFDKVLEQSTNNSKVLKEQCFEMKEKTTQVQAQHEDKLNGLFKEIRKFNESLDKNHNNLSMSFKDHFENMNDVVARALDRSKNDILEKHLLNSILDGYNKLVNETAKSNKAMSSNLSKELDKQNVGISRIAGILSTQEDFSKVLKDTIERHASNLLSILKRQESELIDYNNKMDALPWKHKVENDRQTQVLLEALDKINNENVKSGAVCQDTVTNNNAEVLLVLHKIEEDSSNKTRLIDRQNKHIQKNLQTFLQAFEKELVFVTNAATSNIKDHVDRVAHAELLEFNNKFDTLSSGLLSENAMIQETKRNVHDATQMLVDQLKIIENIANQAQEETRAGFKKITEQNISSNLDNMRRALENQDALLTEKLNQISQRNEKQLVELKNSLKESALSQDLQNSFVFENVTSMLQHLKSEVEEFPSWCSADINKQTQFILQEIKRSNDNAGIRHKQELKQIEVAANKIEKGTKDLIRENVSKALQKNDKELLGLKQELEELPSKYSIENNKQTQLILHEIKQEAKVVLKEQAERSENIRKQVQQEVRTAFEALKDKTDLNLIYKNISTALDHLEEELKKHVSLSSNKQTQLIVEDNREIRAVFDALKDKTDLDVMYKNISTALNHLEGELKTLPSHVSLSNDKQTQLIIGDNQREIRAVLEALKDKTDANLIYKNLSTALDHLEKELNQLPSHVKQTQLTVEDNQREIRAVFDALKNKTDLNVMYENISTALDRLEDELKTLPTYVSLSNDKQTQLIIQDNRKEVRTVFEALKDKTHINAIYQNLRTGLNRLEELNKLQTQVSLSNDKQTQLMIDNNQKEIRAVLEALKDKPDANLIYKNLSTALDHLEKELLQLPSHVKQTQLTVEDNQRDIRAVFDAVKNKMDLKMMYNNISTALDRLEGELKTLPSHVSSSNDKQTLLIIQDNQKEVRAVFEALKDKTHINAIYKNLRTGLNNLEEELNKLPSHVSLSNEKQTQLIIDNNQKEIRAALKDKADVNLIYKNISTALNHLEEECKMLPSYVSLSNDKQTQLIIEDNRKEIHSLFEAHKTDANLIYKNISTALNHLEEECKILPSYVSLSNDKHTQLIIEDNRKEIHSLFEAHKTDANLIYKNISTALDDLEEELNKLSSHVSLSNDKQTLLILAALKDKTEDNLIYKNISTAIDHLEEEIKKLPLHVSLSNAKQTQLIIKDNQEEFRAVFEALNSMYKNLSAALKYLEEKIIELSLHVSLSNDKQTQLIVEAIIDLREKQASNISSSLKNVETNPNETMLKSLQTVFNKDIADLTKLQNKVEEKIDYATNKFETDMEIVKHHLDALSGIDKILQRALENHSESVRRHVENQTVSSRDILNTIEVRLGKLHENDQEHTVISSGIKDDINATQQLVSDYYEKIHKQCNNRSSLSDILQALQDHSANTTDFQKQLENKLRSLSQEQLGNLTALINATRKDTDSGVLKEISTLTNDTYFKIIEVFDKHDEKNSKIQESMKMIEDLTEVLNGNIAISFERLIDEIQTLQKLEEVMAQTSDSVTDTKRRVEHGVREISMEIGNLIKSQMQDLNASVDARFNNLQSSLMDIDNGAIANISTSLTNDLDHVWRQIGIMHQEVSMITDLLNKLDHNTQRYINGTTRNVDITRGKVTQMQSSISQIDHNLNTLLGRFSLITQEFNLIKLNVGNALNEIKRTLQNSPPKTKPTGPGPHIINSI